MHKQIDLHGLIWEEAQTKILFLIRELKNDQINSFLLITGNGTATLRELACDILEQNDITYHLQNNNGAIYCYLSINNKAVPNYKYDELVYEKENNIFLDQGIANEEIDDLFSIFKNKV